MEPPDVIVFDRELPKDRVKKWFDLANWAFDHNDKYLLGRAMEMIYHLSK